MKHKMSILILSVILTAGVIAVILIHWNRQTDSKNLKKEYMNASWSQSYSDVADITRDSNLIALVKVRGLVQTEGIGRIPASIFEVKVVEPILGCEKDELLNIYMTGGETDDTVYELSDDPLMEKGQEFLIFADRNQDGTYSIQGGPQGRLVYEDGKLNSLQNTELPHSRVSLEESKKLSGINVIDESMETVRKEIDQAMKSK